MFLEKNHCARLKSQAASSATTVGVSWAGSLGLSLGVIFDCPLHHKYYDGGMTNSVKACTGVLLESALGTAVGWVGHYWVTGGQTGIRRNPLASGGAQSPATCTVNTIPLSISSNSLPLTTSQTAANHE